MEQFKRILASLSTGQRIITVAVVLLVLGGIYSIANWRKEADFKPLYTGLAAEDSAAVVAKLKESGAEYRLSPSGDSVLVPSAKLADARLELAAAGLPKTGRIGYELFDKSNLGATEFVEHINYRRALEGELERSVMALSEVEQARVHVSFPKDSVFLESREAAKASVMVKVRRGMKLSPRNVMAITHLVGSAVEGLTPNNVSVLDMQGNLLSRPAAASADEAASEAGLEHRQKVERDLLQKINATLDPLLGPERYRASVSADCEINSGEQSEETLDPTHSVMVQSQKSEEVTGTGSGGPSGVPGTASNLPRPTSRPGSSSLSTNRRTENVTYQSSRITKNMKLPQGAIKRLSVALLLDQAVRWEGSGKSMRKIVTPPAPEAMKTVRDVVSAVVGFNQERGDLITVESLPFAETVNQSAPEPPETGPQKSGQPVKWGDWKHQPLLIPIAVGGAVVLCLVIVLIVMRRRKKSPERDMEMVKQLPGASSERAQGTPDVTEQIEAQLAQREEEQRKSDMVALASIKMPIVKTKKAEVLAKQLRDSAQKDPAPAGQILQSWIHERS
jgi:flagellar M-ring protein FliF